MVRPAPFLFFFLGDFVVQEQMSNIEWKLRQLWMAVDYYGRASQNGADIEMCSETIASFKRQIKDLESERDEQGK